MNPLNYFPKTIDVAEYVSKVDIPEIYYGRKAYLTLTPKFRTDEFRLSYTMYGDEGGAIAYLPLEKKTLKRLKKKAFLWEHLMVALSVMMLICWLNIWDVG